METATKIHVLAISSPSFEQGGPIPVQYTCEGENINPALQIEQIPDETKSLALIMNDPDAPNGTFYHWIAYNIPVQTTIEESTNPGISGTNSFGKTGYGGPCPPSGTHRYFFTVYALDQELDIAAGADQQQLLQAMQGAVIATGELKGTYKKQQS